LNGAGESAAQAAVACGCANGGSGFIASANSGSRRLRQTQWYCRNADRNQSKFNQGNLSHIIPSIPRRPWFERRVCHRPNVLREQIRSYGAPEGFFSATVEVSGAPSFELG
jgi:hypothetical protein